VAIRHSAATGGTPNHNGLDLSCIDGHDGRPRSDHGGDRMLWVPVPIQYPAASCRCMSLDVATYSEAPIRIGEKRTRLMSVLGPPSVSLNRKLPAADCGRCFRSSGGATLAESIQHATATESRWPTFCAPTRCLRRSIWSPAPALAISRCLLQISASTAVTKTRPRQPPPQSMCR